MELKFTKMHGCGNDYIYVNCFEQHIDDPAELARKLARRRFSVGGDGVILICPSDAADAKMRMFNADGSEGKMCGNGIRCVAKYLRDEGMVSKDDLSIDTLSGVKSVTVSTGSFGKVVSAAVDMGRAELAAESVPVKLPGVSGGELVISAPFRVGGADYAITCVSMGNPHCVVFTDQPVEGLALETIGPLFERNAAFPDGVNAEFVNVADGVLKMRVWERGSSETLACGTGACAVAVAAVVNGYRVKGEDIRVALTGGELIVNYTDERVLMTGPAVKVYDGVVAV